jgi:hypothetical protein
MVMSSTFVVLSKLFELPLSIGHGCRIAKLSDTEADHRLKRDGSNTLREFRGISIWAILLRQVIYTKGQSHGYE